MPVFKAIQYFTSEGQWRVDWVKILMLLLLWIIDVREIKFLGMAIFFENWKFPLPFLAIVYTLYLSHLWRIYLIRNEMWRRRSLEAGFNNGFTLEVMVETVTARVASLHLLMSLTTLMVSRLTWLIVRIISDYVTSLYSFCNNIKKLLVFVNYINYW